MFSNVEGPYSTGNEGAARKKAIAAFEDSANEITSKLNKKRIKPIKLSRNGKAVLGVGLGAAAIGTGVALMKNKKKKEEDK